jgi:microcystin-dependent protein
MQCRDPAIDERASRADFCRRAYSDRLNFTLHVLGSYLGVIWGGAGVSAPFIAEVKIISFSYPPKGWAFCNGQLQAINQNQAMFSVIGTAYGGDGIRTFGLPNLQGRTPVHTGGQLGNSIGTIGGEEQHTLSLKELPAHIHFQQGTTQAASAETPGTNLVAQGTQIYHGPADLQPMASDVIGFTGGNQPHENRAPYLVLNFVIALTGIFPSRN